MDYNGNITSNSVGSAAIQNNAVTLSKINGMAVTQVFNATTTSGATGSATVCSAGFNTNGGTLLINWDATGFGSVFGNFAFYLYIDGVYQNTQSIMYLNQANIHTSFPGTSSVISGLAAGSHTLSIQSSASLTTDSTYDHCYASVLELPH